MIANTRHAQAFTLDSLNDKFSISYAAGVVPQSPGSRSAPWVREYDGSFKPCKGFTRRRHQPLRLTFAVLMLLFAGCGKTEKPIVQANNLFLQAQESLAAGDKPRALEALNQSIAIEPALWSYHERAKLQAQMGDDQAALADCDAALKLDPSDADAVWLQTEFKKPVTERFKGKAKSPPSSKR